MSAPSSQRNCWPASTTRTHRTTRSRSTSHGATSCRAARSRSRRGPLRPLAGTRCSNGLPTAAACGERPRRVPPARRRRDRQTAVDWYERQRSGLGVRFLDVVETTVNRASRSPRIGTPVGADEQGSVSLRTMSLGGFPWTLAYEVVGDVRSSFWRCSTSDDFRTTGWNAPSSGGPRTESIQDFIQETRRNILDIGGTRRTRKSRKTCSAASFGTRRTPERLLIIRRSWVRCPPAPPPSSWDDSDPRDAPEGPHPRSPRQIRGIGYVILVGNLRTAPGMRERTPGVWEIVVQAGRDPITGRHRQVSRTVRGSLGEAM